MRTAMIRALHQLHLLPRKRLFQRQQQQLIHVDCKSREQSWLNGHRSALGKKHCCLPPRSTDPKQLVMESGRLPQVVMETCLYQPRRKPDGTRLDHTSTDLRRHIALPFAAFLQCMVRCLTRRCRFDGPHTLALRLSSCFLPALFSTASR